MSELNSNRLLSLLPDAERHRLGEHLTGCRLGAGSVLQREDTAVEYVFFPTRGIVSSKLIMPHGTEVVSALIGNEGAAYSAIGPAPGNSFSRATVCLPGGALRVSFSVWRELLHDRGVHEIFAGYHAFRLFEAQQHAACNLLHDVESRLCRWMLDIQDRAGGLLIPMTHSDLAALTGVRRTTVTLIAGRLEAAGIIDNRRGMIEITDRFALEAAACECYGAIRARRAAFELEFERSDCPVNQR